MNVQPVSPPQPQPQDSPDNDAAAAAASIDPRQQRGSISSFLLLTFILFMFNGGGGDDVLTRVQFRDALQSLIYAQGNYSAWLNGTASNFTLQTADPNLPPLAHAFLPNAHAEDSTHAYAFYHNVTGYLNGDVRFRNLTAMGDPAAQTLANAALQTTNFTEVKTRLGSWNWTDTHKATLSVLEIKPVEAQILNTIHGKLEFANANTEGQIRFTFEGLHFPKNGSFYGFIEPKGRHPDLRQLSSLVPESIRNETAKAINPELVQRIRRLTAMINSGSLEVEAAEEQNEITSCPFVFYGQLQPAHVAVASMEELEREMEEPTGITTIRRPPLILDAVLISPECAILIQIEHAKGLTVQRFWRKATTYAGIASLLYLALVYLLIKQMGLSQTPAMITRIAWWTIVSQCSLDAFSFTAHVTFAIVADNQASIPLIAPGFISLILLIYELQFSSLLRDVQSPEDSLEPSVRPPVPPSDAQQPYTATLRHRVVDAFWRWQRFRIPRVWKQWLTFLALLVVALRVLFDPESTLVVVGAMHYLLWVPQIVRNVRRNVRSALCWPYVLGVTACRLFFAMYIFTCPENVLNVQPMPWARYLPLSLTLQLIILFAQERLGPAFFLPKGWIAVDTYDYHPLLPLPDPEAPETALGDCAICMDAIVVDAAARPKSNLLPNPTGTRAYALAPCHHLFHTHCLERWLAIKNICPQCRRPLPPL